MLAPVSDYCDTEKAFLLVFKRWFRSFEVGLCEEHEVFLKGVFRSCALCQDKLSKYSPGFVVYCTIKTSAKIKNATVLSCHNTYCLRNRLLLCNVDFE